MKEGEQIDFFCPLCGHILKSDFDENLVQVIMTDQGDREHEIYFSRIAGEKSTYQVTGDTVTATGEHSGKYTYFKMSEKYKRFLKR